MAAEKYLRGNIVDCVREFVNINEEAALVDLFRMHLVDDVEAFNEILQILPNSMTLAKAYLLNEYVFAISTTSRSITAFKAYRKTRDEKIKKEIQENYLLTALSIIAFMNEDDFMDFLKLVEIRYNKRILNRLQKKGWLPSVSYILQNAKETEKEDFALS